MKLKINKTQDTIEFTLLSIFYNLFPSLFPIRFRSAGKAFYSHSFDFYFNSFTDYWLEIGSRQASIDILKISQNQVEAFSMKEACYKLACSVFQSRPGVIFFDVDPQKVFTLLERTSLPSSTKLQLQKDFIFVHCATRYKAEQLCKSIPVSLAYCIAFDNNIIVSKNYEGAD